MKSIIINILLAIVLIVSLTACGGSSGGSDEPEPRFEITGHHVRYVDPVCYFHYRDMGYSDFDAFNACRSTMYQDDIVSVSYINRLVVRYVNENQNDVNMTVVVTDTEYGDLLYDTYRYDTDEANDDYVSLAKSIWPRTVDVGKTLEVEVWLTDTDGRTTPSYVFDITITE
jgi:hypothetical protein